MPAFPKPKFEFEYSVEDEIKLLRQHKQTRAIPKRRKDKLLVATWNVANFGLQQRRDQDRSILAEIMSWFDIVAIQECRENFGDLFDVHQKLPKPYRVVLDARRPGDVFGLSTRTHTEWTFRSDTVDGDDFEPFSVMQLDYRLDTDLRGDVAKGRTHRIALRSIASMTAFT